jgi:hypothetical protein
MVVARLDGCVSTLPLSAPRAAHSKNRCYHINPLKRAESVYILTIRQVQGRSRCGYHSRRPEKSSYSHVYEAGAVER